MAGLNCWQRPPPHVGGYFGCKALAVPATNECMRNESLGIATTFAPETKFEVMTQSDSWQLELAELPEPHIAHQLRPLVQQLFEKPGVPFSALND